MDKQFFGVRAVRAICLIALFVCGAVAAPSGGARAQSLWLPRETDKSVMLEMARPSLEGVNGSTFQSAFYLGARFGVTSHIAVVGEIPYSRMDATFDYFSSFVDNGSTIGNVYAGIETKGDGPFFAELGVRAPTADEGEYDALILGQLGDLVRRDAFFAKTTSIRLAANLRQVTSSNFMYRLRFSPLFTTGDGSYGDNELFADYSLEVGYLGRSVRVGAGTSGWLLLTEDFGNLGTRGQTQFDLHADFLAGSIRPGIGLRLPTGDYGAFNPIVICGTVSFMK